MARNNRTPNMKKLNGWLGNVNQQMDLLYKNTYFSDRSNSNDVDNISDDIENNINDIISRNKTSDIAGISQLYSRMKLQNAISDGETQDTLKNLFEGNPMTNEVLSSYIGNRWITELDNEIDIVLKYCTKMQDALDLLQEAVLSSDSFSKEFLNLKLSANSSSKEDLAIFSQRITHIIKKYKIEERVKQWDSNARKYGEQFVYVVPYSKAISTLLNNQNNNGIKHSTVNISESSKTIKHTKNINDELTNKIINESWSNVNNYNSANTTDIQVEFDISRTLKSSIEAVKLNNAIIKEGSNSLYESFINEAKNSNSNKGFDQTIPDDIEIPKEILNGTDGFINTNTDKVTIDDLKLKGCVVKSLKRDRIIPMYIDDDICLGYYYIEFQNEFGHNDIYTSMTNRYADSRNLNSVESASKAMSSELTDVQVDSLIKGIASKISRELDKNFINANKDLTKEIYAILKYNDIYNTKTNNHIRVSFLPEEDVHRLVFEEDENTHRGISACSNGLIPAKLYSCLYVTNSTGILSRGQDKRVYYVKQTVDSNISQTLLNVINQIKKSNFGIRQIENLNNILNVTGRFNDFVIPVGQSGDSPVQFEVMPGQQFDINSELYNMLEEMAVNSIGIPIEMVQSRNSPDFATQFTTSSIKILRTVFGLQAIDEKFIGGVISKLYNYEYGENVTIECELPPPVMFNITNNSQLIESTKTYLTSIADYEILDDGKNTEQIEMKKARFIRKMMRFQLSSYLPIKIIDKFKREIELEMASEIPKEEEV